MSLKSRLDLRVQQGVVMSSQLRQAIEILQMPALELDTFLQDQYEQNPLLTQPDEVGVPDSDLADLWQGVTPAKAASLDSPDSGVMNYPQIDTLQDLLISQVRMSFVDIRHLKIGLKCIELLDDDGYLRENVSEIADLCGASIDDVRDVLKILKTFEPCGVFAASIEECLFLQWQDKYGEKMLDLVEKVLTHLDHLKGGQLGQLVKVCGGDEAGVMEIIRDLRTLNPKPGQSFAAMETITIVPDIAVYKGVSGIWSIELNPNALGRFQFDSNYYKDLKGVTLQSAEKSYLENAKRSAQFLIKALSQRAQTIMRVAGEIVKRQHAFLEIGHAGISPLTLRQVAEALDMHESTISRATAGKYMYTPWGTFELKYFFSQAINQQLSGDEVSATAVQAAIRDIISGEPHEKPHADESIQEILMQQGLEVARRTIAKYRTVLAIPSSAERKRKYVVHDMMTKITHQPFITHVLTEKNGQTSEEEVARPAGVEPATFSLEG